MSVLFFFSQASEPLCPAELMSLEFHPVLADCYGGEDPHIAGVRQHSEQ